MSYTDPGVHYDDWEVLLHPVQLDFLQSNALYRAFVGGRGAGKALAIDTVLPTPGGWATMESVQPGDLLFDEKGKPCSVVAVTEVMDNRPCFEVVFSDGEVIVADGAHEWLTETHADRKSAARYHPSIKTTREIASTILCENGEANHSIPLASQLHSAGKQSLRNQRRYIKEVRPVASVPVKCVQVDSTSHLYLAGRSMIATHNSFIGAYDLLTRACALENRLFMVVSPTFEMHRVATMRTFLALAERLGKVRDFNKTSWSIILDSGSTVVFKSGEFPDRLRGPSISGCWIDEAQDCHEDVFNISIPCLREKGEAGFLTTTFTPKGKRHWTYNVFGKNEELRRTNIETRARGEVIEKEHNPNRALFHCKTSDNPFLPPNFESEIKTTYTSAMQAQELGGEFIEAGGKMFRREWFTRQDKNGNFIQFVKFAPRQGKRVRYWDKACLISGTLVETGDGFVPIEEVCAGQTVCTREGARNVLWAGKTKVSDGVVWVTFANGSRVCGTADHPVLIRGCGWLGLGDLQTGQQALTDGFRLTEVLSVHKEIGQFPVYDLTVEDAHEFFANGILVHNSTEGGGCWTAGVLICGAYDGTYYVEHVIRGQWTTGHRDEVMQLTAKTDTLKYGPGNVKICIEQEPGSGGVDSVRANVKQLAGYIVKADKVTGSKTARAEAFASQCERGNVFLVDGDWNADWLDEMVAFPPEKKGPCDMVDASSGSFNQIVKGVYSFPAAAGSSLQQGGGSGATIVPSGNESGIIPGRSALFPGPGLQQGAGMRNFKPI